MNGESIIQKVNNFLEHHGVKITNEKVLVAVSGGADSVALLIILKALGAECVMAHCNFHLRGEESNRDQMFVENLSKKLDLPLCVKDFDVYSFMATHKISMEMAARELRYDWFSQLMADNSCRWLAVGHHIDDNIETFLLNSLRGSGISGLVGIKPINGNIIRPLLPLRRSEIESFLVSINQNYIVDSTNDENDVKRNKIRNIIIPILREYFPDAEVGLAKTIDNMQGCYDLYSDNVEALKKELVVDCGDIYKIDMAKLSKRVGADTILFEMLKDYGYNSYQSKEIMEQWKSHQSTGAIFYSNEFVAVLNRDYLDITSLEKFNRENQPQSVKIGEIININGAQLLTEIVDFDESVLKKSPTNVAYFSTEILDKEIIVRSWKEGDRIKPFGMRGSKKISDILSDAKLSIIDKQNVAVLEINGEIVWVLDMRRGMQYPIEDKANKVVKFSYLTL